MAASLPPGTTFPRGLPNADSIQWSLIPARELFELKYGKALVEANRLPGSIPVYGTNGRCGSHDKALFSGPGVILGRKGQGPLGVEWCDTGYWVIDTAYSLVPLRPDVNLKYAYFLIKLVGLNHLKDGTSNPTLSRDAFGAQALPLPPLAEQRAIAHILGTLDDKIELNRRMNETLEAMTRALFQSWFVDFDPVRAKAEGRDPGLPQPLADLFPDRFEDSVLGEIPAGWRVATVGDEVQLVKGVSYRSEQLAPSDTALVTLKSINRGGGYRPDGLKEYTGDYKAEQVLSPRELVVAQTDVTQAAEVIGKPALVVPDKRFLVLVASLDLLIVRPKKADLRQAYFYLLFQTPAFQDHVYGHTNGTTVLHLSKTGVPSFQFARPPEQLARVSINIIDRLFDRVIQNDTGSRTLAALRDTLLPKLISGELRVKDAERFLGRTV